MNQAIAPRTLAAKGALPAKEFRTFLLNISTSITIMIGNIDIEHQDVS